MPVSLAEWLDTMTMCENLVKVRQNGRVLLSSERIPVAISLASKVGVDFEDWLRVYFSDSPRI